MFITNGYQAFSDYSPTREDLYASSLFDRKSIPSFEPHGRVVVSVNQSNWVLDIHSTYESRLLTLGLIRYFINSFGGSRTVTADVEKALCEISHYGITIRSLTPIVENEDSFIHDFRFEKTLSREHGVHSDVVCTVVYYLKKIYTAASVIDTKQLKPVNGIGVSHLVDNIFINHNGDKQCLIVELYGSFYLTSLPNTSVNVDKLKIVTNEIIQMRNLFKTVSKGFVNIVMATINKIVRRRVNIRPAILIAKPNDGYTLIHRPFLSSEKTFDDARPSVQYSAKVLLS